MVTEEAGARPEPPGAALRGVASRGSQPEEAGGPDPTVDEPTLLLCGDRLWVQSEARRPAARRVSGHGDWTGVWLQQVRVTHAPWFAWGFRGFLGHWAIGAEVGNLWQAWAAGHPSLPWVKAKSTRFTDGWDGR